MALQKEFHKEMDKHYYENESILSKIKSYKERINRVQVANDELKFNVKRQEDMLPLVSIYKERLKNNENLIANLKNSIEETLKQNPKENKIDEKISNLYLERKKFEEKKLQVINK